MGPGKVGRIVDYALRSDAARLPALASAEALRAAGVSVLLHAQCTEGLASVKSQFK